MQDLQGLLSVLPEWAQLILLLVVVGGGVLFGRKNKKGKPKAKPQGRPQSKQAAVADPSPGQFGKDATVDLRPEEIRKLKISYSPSVDRDPDPGEVVWTWVPYAENDGRGKDRPVLIVARINATTVAGCYLSTKDHYGFIEVGPGPWDGKGRTSYLSPERVLRVTHDGMRREGSTMPKKTFARVTQELAKALSIN